MKKKINIKKLIPLLIVNFGLYIILKIIFIMKIILPLLITMMFWGDVTKEGIESFDPQYSYVSLTHYITLRDGNKENFFEKYDYEDINYRNHYYSQGYLTNEIAIITVKYSKDIFEEAKDDIYAKDCFGEYMCNYKNYTFNVNHCYSFNTTNSLENYNFDNSNPYIHWINCVGINDSEQTIVFIGFYYYEMNPITGKVISYYNLDSWEQFFEEYFPEIE